MSDCQATTSTWKGKPLHVCEACNIRTLSESTLRARCQADPPRQVRESPVVSPGGEPYVVDEPVFTEPTDPTSHDDI